MCWSGNSGFRFPSFRKSMGILWHAASETIITPKERLVILGWPLYPELCLAAGLQRFEFPNVTRGHKFAGNAYHVTAFGMWLLTVLACARIHTDWLTSDRRNNSGVGKKVEHIWTAKLVFQSVHHFTAYINTTEILVWSCYNCSVAKHMWYYSRLTDLTHMDKSRHLTLRIVFLDEIRIFGNCLWTVHPCLSWLDLIS